MQQRMRRSGITIGLLSIGLLATVALTASPARAASDGPYYAEPAWDQTLPGAKRFVVLSNFASVAVLDKETGLVWEKSPRIDPQSWVSANNRCVGIAIGGRKGWRLPSIPELTSLIDPSVAPPGPTLPAGHPFNVVSLVYWSASTLADFPAGAWDVNFGSGLVETNGKATNGFSAWCVRGPMQESVY